MKKRNIPFGYQYQNGVITAHPQEVTVLNHIFSEYQKGMSLLEIANRLNDDNVEYQPGVTGWNKSRIMRLIEDERYIGKDGFGYIAGWSSGRELKELRSSLEIIRDTAAEIIDGVESQLQELRQNREQEEEISSPVMAM